MRSFSFIRALLPLFLLQATLTWSFTIQSRRAPTTKSANTLDSVKSPLSTRAHALHAHENNGAENGAAVESLEIVLFGTGDYRTTDHSGLNAALAAASAASPSLSSAVVPLVILDTEDTLPNMPMGRTHTLDTAALISASITSLGHQLSQLGLDLNVKTSSSGSSRAPKKTGMKDLLKDFILQIKNEHPSVQEVTVHTCDLGHVDNALGYGPHSHLANVDMDMDVGVEINLKSWDCNLRRGAWEEVMTQTKEFPDTFVDYEKKFGLGSMATKIVSPIDELSLNDAGEDAATEWNKVSIPTLHSIPTAEEITKLLCVALDISYDMSKLEDGLSTGLYATHWGGLDISSTFTEDCVLQAIDIFLGQKDNEEEGDEALVKTLKWWCGTDDNDNGKLVRNEKSLEHSAIHWMMTGGGESSSSASSIKTENLIEGELLTRYLAAPLLFGMISPRYIWNKANAVDITKQQSTSFFNDLIPSMFQSRRTVDVMKTIVEGREWHQLFATKNLLSGKGKESTADGTLDVGYWRWHGFLCRFVGKSFSEEGENESGTKNDSDSAKKDGIALVHGFGASGSQWLKAIQELASIMDGQDAEALAPDLIGFGQCEKPSLTYTQYLWESYTAAFMKEIALGKKDWGSFVIGGNSIGGYTAMSFAADDRAVVSSQCANNVEQVTVSASGASGSQRCKGLILMNSAGKVFKEGEVERLMTETGVMTVAEATASGRIGESSPPSRRIATVGGEGLLWYLRPRIQSICVNLYPTNPAAVDDVLCNGILRDSLDPGALNVMISGSKLPPPRTANELLGADFGSSTNDNYNKDQTTFSEAIFDGPVLVAQGILDPLNDAKGRAEMFGALRNGIVVNSIDAGHCPHDELPESIAKSISTWISSDIIESSKSESVVLN